MPQSDCHRTTVLESPADHNRSILAVCVPRDLQGPRSHTRIPFFFQTAQPGCGEGSSTHYSPTSPVVRAQQVNRPEVSSNFVGSPSMHCHASRLPPSPIQVFEEATMHNIRASMNCTRLAAIREPGWTIRSGRSKSCKLDILHHMVLLSDCVNSVTRMAHLAEDLKLERRGSPLPTRT